MKAKLARRIQASQDDDNLNDLKSYLTEGARIWFKERFPDADFEKGKDNGGKYIKIYYQGKLSEDE